LWNANLWEIENAINEEISLMNGAENRAEEKQGSIEKPTSVSESGANTRLPIKLRQRETKPYLAITYPTLPDYPLSTPMPNPPTSAFPPFITYVTLII